MTRGKVLDRSVYLFGFAVDIYRRRQDGYTRIEFHNFEAKTKTVFYLNDDERRKLAAAFALPDEQKSA